VANQVLSVGSLALNIATVGATQSSKAAITAAKDASKLQDLRNQL